MKQSILYPLIYLGIAIVGAIWNNVVSRLIVIALFSSDATLPVTRAAILLNNTLSLIGGTLLAVFVLIVLRPLKPRHRWLRALMVLVIVTMLTTMTMMLIASRLENMIFIWATVLIRVALELLSVVFGVMVLVDRDSNPLLRGAFAVYLGVFVLSTLFTGVTGNLLFQSNLLQDVGIEVRRLFRLTVTFLSTVSFMFVLHAIFREEEQYQEMERTVPLADLD